VVLFADNQSKLYALDKNTGKVVYSRDVPNSGGGSGRYEVNGRQYIPGFAARRPGFPGAPVAGPRRRESAGGRKDVRGLCAAEVI
jgi:quinoprotein glucose dehydrogenase